MAVEINKSKLEHSKPNPLIKELGIVFEILSFFIQNTEKRKTAFHEIHSKIYRHKSDPSYKTFKLTLSLREVSNYIIKNRDIKHPLQFNSISKEYFLCMILRDYLNLTVNEIASILEVSVGTVLTRLELGRAKTFQNIEASSDLTLSTNLKNHSCIFLKDEIENNQFTEVNQNTCPSCNQYIINRKLSQHYFKITKIDPISDDLIENESPKIIQKTDGHYRFNFKTSPWYLKLTIESLLAILVIVAVVILMPKIKYGIERWQEKRLDLYLFNEFSNKTAGAEVSVINNEQSVETQTLPQSITSQKQESAIPPNKSIQSQSEFIGRDAEKPSSDRVYRFLFQAESPKALESQIKKLVEKTEYLIARADSNELSQELPGGHIFDFFIPIKNYKPFLSSISGVGEMKLIITRSRETGKQGMVRIKIWVQQI